jgi:putative transport protein
VSNLFFGDGVAHTILVFALVIVAGISLEKIKIKGISLGVTWILFAGIAFSHFGMRVDPEILHVFQEFGLILFVFSVGLQVGPGFFSSFKKGGVTLNLLALGVVLLGVAVTYVIYLCTGIPISTMVGIMSGAVTNTPGLGAAQQTNIDMTGAVNPDIATGYAMAYPLGVIGIILTIAALKYIFKINYKREEESFNASDSPQAETCILTLRVMNPALSGMKVGDIHDMIQRNFVISRIHRTDGSIEMVNSGTELYADEEVLVTTSKSAVPAITAFIGKEVKREWNQIDSKFISRRILVTKPEPNGQTLSQLRLQSFGVSITRVNRSGIDLIANPGLELQFGDRVMVVGTEQAIAEVEKKLGNSLKRLNHPNIFPLFVGIAIGVLFGSIPFTFQNISNPIKLGLAGGPLIVAILISRFGPKYKLVTYTTMSANLMLREIGIALFLACVGLRTGETFIATIVGGGYQWVAYGILITIIPILTVGIIGRKFLKLNYFTLSGLIAGSTTDPPALAYSNEVAGNDIPAISYATVYPLTMFLRVLCAQLMIL